MPRTPNTTCSICSIPIYRRPSEMVKSKSGKVFCGKRCYGMANRIETSCLSCGKMILAGRHSKTCSVACSNKARTGMKYKQQGRPSKSRGTTNRTLRVALIRDRGHSCEGCSYDRFLIVHHMVERSKGGTDDLKNLLLLCPNCHSEIHQKIDGKAIQLQRKRLLLAD